MRCIPHGRRGPAQYKSNCEQHAGSDKRFENKPYSLTNNRINSIYKGKDNTEKPGSESRSEHATSME